MTNLRSSLNITKASGIPLLFNFLALVANKPARNDDYCRRMELEHVLECFRRHGFEDAEQEIEEEPRMNVKRPEVEEDYIDLREPLVQKHAVKDWVYSEGVTII